MSELPRYYITEDKFGWSVRDRENGEYPNNVRASYFAAMSFRSKDAAKRAAEAKADQLNAEAGQ